MKLSSAGEKVKRKFICLFWPVDALNLISSVFFFFFYFSLAYLLTQAGRARKVEK
jgi:hypothetical protein